ncbi:hypothetical protein ACVIIV_003391 [Bradyrhizobium sp. USDA 4354]
MPPLNRLVRYRCRNVGFRSLPCLLALTAKGPRRDWRSFRDMRRSGSREQPQPAELCTRCPTTRKPIFTAEHLRSGWPRKSRARRVCCWLSAGVLGLFNTDPVGREGGLNGGRTQEPLGSRDSHQMRSARASSPDRASRVCPFDLACGPRAAAMVIPISLIGERFYIVSTIEMHDHSRSRSRSISLRHNLRG